MSNRKRVLQNEKEEYNMMTKNNNPITKPTEREVVITRLFRAPRELLFRACTDPNLIPRWWKLKRFTTTIDKMDVRPGGIWRFVRCAPDGNKYVFNAMYHEIVPPERLVYTFEFEGTPGHVALETVTFEEEHDGKTKLTDRILFQTVEDRDMMFKSGIEQGLIFIVLNLD
jgi:uncharacterized protein YndB with AHSA1/START domain